MKAATMDELETPASVEPRRPAYRRCLSEFDFCCNTRIVLEVEDKRRTENIVEGIVAKRLTYQNNAERREAKAAISAPK
jgi:hypothetical protein